MQIVNTGHMYQIYDDGVKTFNKLPAQIYTVCFSKMTGFFLQKFDDITINEKVYGIAPTKLDKVVKSFYSFERNLGIILSGAKGIGKSLFAKMLSERMVAEGFPVLIVNTFIPGIADFLTSIQQEVVVLFDEFDKTFYSKDGGDSMTDPQASMLTLFDGLSQGKKMFVVTCNEIRHLNDYIINRPGRFHYHFRFDYPVNKEIEEYLKDKIAEEFYGEITKVVDFANKIPLNYDCLRAIAFELNCGVPFETAITDLNIVNIQNERYALIAVFNDGTKCTREDSIDIFSSDPTSRRFDIKDFCFDLEFTPIDAHYSYEHGGNIIHAGNLDLTWCEWYVDDDERDAFEALRKDKKVEYLLLRRKSDKTLHYMV
jgi:hypothetical protein